MATSQNGWPALSPSSSKLYTWHIPTRSGLVRVRLRNGSAGFLLAHLILWLSDRIEPVHGRTLDDWGYAYRPIRGATRLSNHSSGTAADVNALRHVLGRRGTFGYRVRGKVAAWRIRRALRVYRGCIRWGGDYRGRADEMHFEINASLSRCERRARFLMRGRRGRRILRANPSQRRVILS